MNKKVNPWAVCHASTGPKKSAKFERCVKKVKKDQGIEEMQTLNLMSDKIVEGLQVRLEEQQIIESMMLFCEENDIDVDDLSDDQLNELFGRFAQAIKGAVKGAAGGYKAGMNTPTSAERSDAQLAKVRQQRFARAKQAAANFKKPAAPTPAPVADAPAAPAAPSTNNPVTGKPKAKIFKDFIKDKNYSTAPLGGNPYGEAVELFGYKIIEGLKSLTKKQRELDVNKSGGLDAQDFKMLRAGKKKVADSSLVELKKDTLQSYAKKASAQIDSGKTPEKKEMKRIKGIGKAETKAAKASMGPNNPKNTFKAKPKLNKKYIEGGKKGASETPMPTEKINKSGVGGKPAAGRPGQTKAGVLDKKLAKIDATSKSFMGNLAKNPKNSQK
jgi:hypothetical protein